MALTFSGSICIPLPASIINPRYLVLLVLNSHLLISICKPASHSRASTWCTCSLCRCRDPSVKISILSKYADANLSRKSRNVQLIYYWKVLGALAKLKGITSYSNRPNQVLNAVIHSCPGTIRILWKAAIMSSFVNYLAYDICSRVLLINSNRYQSFLVIAFNA